MLLIIVMTTVVVVGLVAIALAEPRRSPYQIIAWNDEAERRLLRDRKFSAGWW